MPSSFLQSRDLEPPPRPRTAIGYVPTPTLDVVPPRDAHEQLLNEDQRNNGIHVVHSLPRERFQNTSRLHLPFEVTSARPASEGRKMSFKAARETLSKGLRSSKETLSKTKPVVEAAVSAGKKVVAATATNLSQAAARHGDRKKIPKTNVKGPDGRPMSRTSSNSTLYARALYDAKRLPKLVIPDTDAAVEEALHSACSTDTADSDGYQFANMSPTSKDLKIETLRSQTDDVGNEFRNMLSARRRVRKAPFGAEVGRYRLARPTWDEPWNFLRSPNDNFDDRATLRILTDAVQVQKDQATRLVQRNPSAYPGMRPVSAPGCTKTMYGRRVSIELVFL